MLYSEQQWTEWMDALATQDYVVIDSFLSNEKFQNLLAFFTTKREEKAFHKAGIGTDTEVQVKSEIRGDFTYWIEKEQDVEISFIFEMIEELKQKLNRYCFLSLAGYEFHLAHYPKGSFYKKHLDQFHQRSNRMITVLLYLNEDWKPEDEGYLKIYLKDDSTKEIAPIGNRLVLFKSGDLPHEVLPTQSGRNSLTGWLLYQPSTLPF